MNANDTKRTPSDRGQTRALHLKRSHPWLFSIWSYLGIMELAEKIGCSRSRPSFFAVLRSNRKLRHDTTPCATRRAAWRMLVRRRRRGRRVACSCGWRSSKVEGRSLVARRDKSLKLVSSDPYAVVKLVENGRGFVRYETHTDSRTFDPQWHEVGGVGPRVGKSVWRRWPATRWRIVLYIILFDFILYYIILYDAT